jgi:hypothetical protein
VLLLIARRGQRLVKESRCQEEEELARGMTKTTTAIPTDTVVHTSSHQVRSCSCAMSAVAGAGASESCLGSARLVTRAVLQHARSAADSCTCAALCCDVLCVCDVQLNFHLKIVNPTFAAMVAALPSFRIGMVQPTPAASIVQGGL